MESEVYKFGSQSPAIESRPRDPNTVRRPHGGLDKQRVGGDVDDWTVNPGKAVNHRNIPGCSEDARVRHNDFDASRPNGLWLFRFVLSLLGEERGKRDIFQPGR